jgi:DNA-binding NtrC family response regulator
MHIIVVHDEPGFILEAIAALSFAGYSAEGFTDPMAALDALSVPGTAMLVTRVRFGPGKLHGLALARMAMMKCPGIRILFTALPEFEADMDALGDFAPLPISMPDLVDAVGRAMTSADRGVRRVIDAIRIIQPASF